MTVSASQLALPKGKLTNSYLIGRGNFRATKLGSYPPKGLETEDCQVMHFRDGSQATEKGISGPLELAGAIFSFKKYLCTFQRNKTYMFSKVMP